MNEKFSYILENLSLTSISTIETIIGIIVASMLVIGMRWVFLYSYGWKLVSQDAYDLRKKRETLWNLILMKDIQTELEKEIEQAMLKATFQG